MAVIGCLGDILFQVSEEVVETISNMEWSGSARYAVHQRHLQNALTEFTGVDPDKISFEMTLTYELGVNVMDELVKIWTYERAGESLPLVVGDKPYGKYRWNIKNHKIQFLDHDRRGNGHTAKVSVELQEYLRS